MMTEGEPPHGNSKVNTQLYKHTILIVFDQVEENGQFQKQSVKFISNILQTVPKY